MVCSTDIGLSVFQSQWATVEFSVKLSSQTSPLAFPGTLVELNFSLLSICSSLCWWQVNSTKKEKGSVSEYNPQLPPPPSICA